MADVPTPVADAAGESPITFSSIPFWARPDALSAAADRVPTGASYVLVGVGESGAAQVNRWAEVIGHDVAVTRVVHVDADGAASGMRAAISRSVVGVRVLVAAPAGGALRLRALAVTAGLEDDEFDVVVVDAEPGGRTIDVFCSHCRTTNHVDAVVDDVIKCRGCARSLLVYHHVSRRTGAYLGFMVDAELPRGDDIPQESTR